MTQEIRYAEEAGVEYGLTEGEVRLVLAALYERPTDDDAPAKISELFVGERREFLVLAFDSCLAKLAGISP